MAPSSNGFRLYAAKPPQVGRVEVFRPGVTVNRSSDNSNVCGIVLAGGESRRMGRDKLRLEVAGVPLLRRVVETLRGFCAEVIVVGGAGDVRGIGNVRRVRDRRPDGQGPLAGLETGMMETNCEMVLLASGDMPFVGTEICLHMLEIVSCGADAAVPLHSGRLHPVCAAYSVGVAETVTGILEDGGRSMRDLLDRLDKVEYVEDLSRFGDPEIFLMNVNSPEDLELARRLSGGG